MTADGSNTPETPDSGIPQSRPAQPGPDDSTTAPLEESGHAQAQQPPQPPADAPPSHYQHNTAWIHTPDGQHYRGAPAPYPAGPHEAPHAPGPYPTGPRVGGYGGSGMHVAAGPQPAQTPSAPRRRRTGTAIVATVLVAAVLGGAVALGGNALLNHSSSSAPQLVAPVASAAAPAKSGSITFAAQAASKFTADIQVSGSAGTAVGSGIVLTSDGDVLTNNHVVAGAGAGSQIQVTTSDAHTYPATVVGTSPSYDLAVIKLQNASGLTPATLGTSSNLQVGEQVVAVGSPEDLSNTVTSGIISALSRTVTAADEQGSGVTVYNGLQTDTPINPGNSGGPLVNLAGQVIGVNSAVDTGASSRGGVQAFGLGFAIPVDTARRVANQLLADGQATKPILGVTGSLADTSSNPESNTAATTSGAQLTNIQSGSAAAKAGLKAGDVITKVDSQPVSNYADLMAQILTHKPGETVSLTVAGSGGQHTVSVTLGSAVDTQQTTVPTNPAR